MQIFRNSIINFLGGIGPAVMMVISTPIILNHIGLEQYGILTIITAVIGYFSIIDINFTSGSIKYISEFNGRNDREKLSQTITLGFIIYLIIGSVGFFGIYFFADKIAEQAFKITPNHLNQAIQAFHIGAVGFFLSQLQQYLNSLPQSVHRFDISAKLETIFGIATPALSILAILIWQVDLLALLFIRVLLSGLHAIALFNQIFKLFPDYKPSMPDRRLTNSIFSFSGYSFLSKIASVTYAHGDKLIIGATLGMAAVSIYSIPATVVNRFLGMTFRLSSVIFPVASELSAKKQFAQLETIYLQMSRYINYLNATLVALLILFSREILTYWIGSEIATSGSTIFSLIALSLLIDTLTNLPSLVNDGLGKSKVSGVFAIARAALGMLAIWLLANFFGTTGVALGHLVASTVFTCAFIFYAHLKVIPIPFKRYFSIGILQPIYPVLVITIIAYWIKPQYLLQKNETLLTSTAVLMLIIIFGWFIILNPNDRHRCKVKILRQK